ncbi:SWIB/MDM2 domain-containing protein [Cryptosporidium muris RN66]|uniref:SWIB/MDM2 domain-containing protein n=1 Tax=Cryptosporidium muris (strain RN66) TaxID=441375 RepID=B6AAD8_CRYMR|nr:SWIB/MDM2 domain-containing protein [Cryptosporidium muris RN66]EEA05179.1 SWIB/MDM2 domain-containing protein [Cryptosporidium muris RN66]|eukprot:XP_002139528.1 SWIB/MDM2 domain-containing protein [Cryptosporidium muris RN66]
MSKLPEYVKEFAEELYNQYESLLDYERLLDETIIQQKYSLSDVWLTLMDDKSIRCYRKKLRVHVFNTFTNQKAQDIELESFNMNNDWTSKNPPSWTLKIQGTILQNESIFPRFTSLFSRIVVNLSENETIIWDKKTSPLPECDGLEIHRIGGEEKNIDIYFFIDYRIPHYSLSNILEDFMGTSISSLPNIIKRLWQYIEINGLHSIQQHPTSIKLDSLLKNIFCEDIDIIQLSDIPDLLKKHLFPPKPVHVSHHLTLKGDWIDNESTYDFTVDLTEHVPGDINLWLPNISTRIQGNSDFIGIHKSLEELYHKNQTIVSKIYHSCNKRNFYLGFANKPIDFIHSLLTTKHFQLYGSNAVNNILSDPNALYEYQIADKYAEYYRQPWVPKAVQKYLFAKNRNFDDRVNKTIASVSAYEKHKRRQTIPHDQHPSNRIH